MRNIYNALTDALEELGIYERVGYTIVGNIITLEDKNTPNSILQLEVVEYGDGIAIDVIDRNLFSNRVTTRIIDGLLDTLT